MPFPPGVFSRISINSALPVTQPPGNPPPSILAQELISGVMPNSSSAPPLATLNPVTTSSNISTIFLSVHNCLSSLIKEGFIGYCPM